MPGAPFEQVLVHARKMAARLEADRKSDRELLEAFTQRRDQSAFESLVIRHGPMVQSVCRRLLRDVADADDAFQATFCVLARKASSIRKVESVGSWLYGVAVRTARHCLAANSRRQFCERQHARSEAVQALDNMTWGELRGVFDEELARINTAYRGPVLLCLLEGCTQEEAARKLGLSQRTLRRRFKLGRDLMQQRLARRGIALTTGLAATLLSQNHTVAAPSALLVRSTVTAGFSTVFRPGLGTAVSLRVAGLVAQAVQLPVLGKLKHILIGIVLASVFVAGGGVIALNIFGLGESGQTGSDERGPELRNSGEQAKERAAKALPPRDQFGDPLPAHVIARLGSMRLRHGGGPYAAAFSPDGRRLASVSSVDKMIRIWDATDGRQLLCINDAEESRRAGVRPVGNFFALSFSPDGETLATSMPIRLWDTKTGRLLRDVVSDYGQLPWVAFSPDGKCVAYGARTWAPPDLQSSKVVVIDVATGATLWEFAVAQKTFCTCAAFSPDGKTLAACMGDALICRWSLETGKELPVLTGHEQRIRSLVFTADGRTLFSGGGDSTIRIWDVSSNKETRRFSFEEKYAAVQITSDGATADPAPLLALSLDGKFLVSGHIQEVRVWDIAQGKELSRFKVENRPIDSMSLSADGKILATANPSDPGVRLWEIPSGKALSINEKSPINLQDACISPNGQIIVSGGYATQICTWDANTGAILRQFPSYGRAVILPDNKTLVGGGWNDGIVHVWDLESGLERRAIKVDPKGVYRLAATSDGKTLITSWPQSGSSIRFWDLETGQEKPPTAGQPIPSSNEILLGSWGQKFATFHPDRSTVYLWDTATGKQQLRLAYSQKQPASLGYSLNGKLLAVGGYDGILNVWDATTGKLLHESKPGPDLTHLTFSADGRTIFWASQQENVIHALEVHTWKERYRLEGQPGRINSLAASRDGKRLVSTGDDGTGLVWDLTDKRIEEKNTSGNK
ncbi:hypothetical protein BH10PLA2_BH10PLA2_16840 [soil metagenome]